LTKLKTLVESSPNSELVLKCVALRCPLQIEDAKVFGIQSFCKELLEVADVLERASKDVTDEVMEKESAYLRDVVQGVRLTEAQLLQVRN
jgi:molecular chaperone GrpE